MANETRFNFRLGAVDRISKSLNKIKNRFKGLSRATSIASTKFRLLQKRTEKLRRSMSRLGKKMRGVGKAMTFKLSAPIALVGAAILRTGVNFQRAINKVGAITRTIVKGQVTKAFIDLEKRALLLGKTTEFSSTQAAEAMALLGRAGFTSAEILASTSDVLALASASGMDLAFTADVMAKTIRAFGLEASDATRVSDVLADVSRRTNVDLETLSETFKDAAPIAKAYGATLEQTAAITGLLGDVGIQGSKAGTTLKSIMLKLAAPTGKANKILEKLNITVVKGAKGMNDVGAILSQLGPALGKFPKRAQLAAINELFGLRGIAGASALMSKAIADGKDPVATLTEVLKSSAGAAKDMQQIMLRGSVGALARFMSALEGIGLAFARSGMLDAFTTLLDGLAGVFSWMSKLNPSFLKWITIIAFTVAALGPLIFVVGAMITALPIFITGLTGVGVAAAFVTGIFGLWLIPIVLVIAAVVRLVSVWDKLKQAFLSGQGIFDTIGKLGSVFFGIGGDESSKKSLAPAKGAKVQQRGVKNGTLTQTNNASVSVDFSNLPVGTRVSSGGEGLDSLDLGFAMGG